MEQKRVSFAVAKAIKEAGYPQDDCDEYLNKYGAIDAYLGYNIARPYVMDVWLWLWREKKIKFSLEPNDDFAECYNSKDFGHLISKICNDPEEAIIAAIEYIVENDLIK